MTMSEPAVDIRCDKELMVSDKTGDLSSKGEFTNVDPAKAIKIYCFHILGYRSCYVMDQQLPSIGFQALLLWR